VASLIDELILVLTQENNEYKDLVLLSHEKTQVIVKGDIEKLQQITDVEQNYITKLNKLEKKRTEVINDIATVLCKNPDELTVKAIADLLSGQPQEREKLCAIHDELKMTLNNMVTVNDLNKNLVNQSLEMIEFDMNLVKSIYQEPETANYSKNAYNTSSSTGAGMFDAKQ